jgi:hypothetical protein
MAGFGDNNDIQIKVTLDTNEAVKNIQTLKQSIQRTLDLTKSQFLRLAEISKEFNKISSQEIKSREAIELKALANQEAAAKRRHDREMARIALEAAKNKLKFESVVQAAAIASAQEVRLAQVAANEKKKLAREEANERLKAGEQAVKLAQSTAKKEVELQREKNLKIVQDTAKIYQDTARIRKGVKAPGVDVSGLRDAAGSGKILDGLSNSILGIGVQFGRVNVTVGTLFKSLGALAGPVGLVTAGFAGAALALVKFAAAGGDVAQSAAKLEGLVTAFDTLQRSVGRVPTESIETLRRATQGLISDTEIYQRANQALLLNVPASLFEKSAEAAVKLGRAMGIDAANALESLSIGLGRQSRLYLDNLGIIVSAEEAYQNFAATNGKVVSNLTEGEKRLAFFNETARKLEEGLATLPPIQDTVGTQFIKLNASLSNLSASFVTGFNKASPLADAYLNLKEEADKLTGAFERLGNVYAATIGYILKNPLSKAIIGGAVGVIDEISKNLAAKFGTELPEQIARAEKALFIAQNNLDKSRKNIPSLLQQYLGYTEKGYQAEVDAAQSALDALKLLSEQAKNIPPVKIKVDTTEIANFASNTSASLNDLTEKIGEGLNKIQVPGIDDSQVNQAIEQAKAIGDQIESGGLKASEAQTAITNLFNSLAESARNVNIDVINKQIDSLNKNSKDYESDLAKLKASRDAYQKSLAVEPKQLERINTAIKKGLDLGKEQAKDRKGASKQFGNELKKQQQELQQFTRGIARALERAIPSDVQKDLVDIFNDPSNDAQKLADKIEQLGEKFREAGGDVQAFIKEAAALKDLKDKIPDRPLQDSAENTKSIDDYNERLKEAQKGTVNLRDLIYGAETKDGKKVGGGFFGFDLGLGGESEAALAGEVQNFLGTALQAGVDGFSREDVPQIAAGLGSLIGGGLAAYFSAGDPTITAAGAQAGAFIGNAFASVLEPFGKDTKGTKQRKAIDQYFAELFDEGRLAVVIQGQLTGAIDQATGAAIRDAQPSIARISDLVFEGITPFAGNVSFGGEGFTNYFDTLSSDIKASFNGVGVALGVLQGISVEQARLIGVALANNVGGSLQNLQVIIQQTGESFDDMAAAVLKSFRDAQLTIEEAYNALVQLQNIYEVGIPGAVGAYEEAIKNLNNILKSDAPGQYALDSLRDIGAEGAEAKKTFDSVIASLGGTFQFTADQQTRLFEALRINGITSLAQLQAASDEQLLAVLRNIQLIRDRSEAPLVTTPVVTTAPKTPSASRGPSAEDKRKEALKKLREETQKLLRDSVAYEEIVRKITDGELTRTAAGKEIVKLQKEIGDALKRRNTLEEAYEKELNKGSKANKKRLGELAEALDAVNKKIEGFTEQAKKSTREFKTLNIAGVIPFIKSANMLGVVAAQVGIGLEKATDVLVKGFLQGRLTLAELNKELDKTKETLGPGIPNAVGAVTEAFQGLIDAGTQGGQFSVDAFRDIFAEFREKFEKEGSALRESERKQLEENLKAARSAFAEAVGPEATAAAKKTLDEAKKALDDFYATVPAPDLADLRAQLNSVFSSSEVDKFFQALGESGISTFADFEKAGTDSVVGILQKLQEIGFNFGQTSQEIIDAQEKLREGEKEANAGLDPLQEAINLIKGLNEGAAQLPPVFNSTTTAIEGLNGPLASLSAGFDDILEKLAILSQKQSFEKDIVFNVSTVGESGAQGLVEILFGDGSGTTTTVSSTTSGGGGSDTNTSQIARLRKEIQRLQKKKSTKAVRDRIATLKKRVVELGG